jgi:hypothetical protein
VLKNIGFLLLVIVLISMVVLSSCSSKQTDAELTDIEKEGIQYIYEVEKVARDVYHLLYEEWGTPVLSIISGSEQSHMDIMKELIDEYNLNDPAEGKDYGEFSTGDLEQLYSDLVELGLSAEVDALSTATMIEEFDIVEIREYVNKTGKDDIILAYNKLMAGSESHILAFVTRLKEKDVEYQPQYLSQQDYDRIIATLDTGVTTTTTTSVSNVTTFNELALNGKQSYGDNCFNCHGDSFTNGSAGYAILSEYQDAQKLLEIISRMPNSGEQEQWEVLSYLLLEHEWVSETATFNADTLSQISLTQ